MESFQSGIKKEYNIDLGAHWFHVLHIQQEFWGWKIFLIYIKKIDTTTLDSIIIFNKTKSINIGIKNLYQ